MGGEYLNHSIMGTGAAATARDHASTVVADSFPSRATIEVYGQAEIAFRGDGWVNATQMASSFGKSPAGFLRTDSAKAFIAALNDDLGKMQNCILVQHGGACPGTWMHPDLALEFARWLSPEFSIWCNRTVRRILRGGAPVGVVHAGVARVLDRIVASNKQLVATQMHLLNRIETLERPALTPLAVAPAAASLVARPAAPEHSATPALDAQVAAVFLAAVAFPRDFGLIHPVEIARSAFDGHRFVELCDDPADQQKVSRLLRFFQGRGFFGRWLRAQNGWQAICEPIGRNRHRRYSITARREEVAS